MKLLSFSIRYLDDENEIKCLQISGFHDKMPRSIGVYHGLQQGPGGHYKYEHQRQPSDEELKEALAKLKQLFINCGYTIE